MIFLKKEQERDFVILNLTDPQLHDREWESGQIKRDVLMRTVTELVERVKPDLITISGDISWAGENKAYDAFADLMDSFQLPWAPVWGNHDNQGGPEFVESVARRYMAHKYCVYEKGDPAMGNGNYVICIVENGRPIEGVILMDSHDTHIDEDGNNTFAKLSTEQIDWYRRQVQELKSHGCEDTLLILHIPIYAYRQASASAYSREIDLKDPTYEMFQRKDCWNHGYEDIIGVQLENVASCTHEDGVLDEVIKLGSTKNIIAGHDHINNWMINYKGVRLIYGLKTGAGSYWHPRLNGGTVFRVTANGIAEVYHEYVDAHEIE